MHRIFAISAAVMALSATSALAGPDVKFDNGMLVDAKGMALYTFEKDEPNKSNCYDRCAVAWPPLMAEASAADEGDWKVIDRTDGTKMWSYKGDPVYYWVKDTKPGDAGGESIPGWFLIHE